MNFGIGNSNPTSGPQHSNSLFGNSLFPTANNAATNNNNAAPGAQNTPNPAANSLFGSFPILGNAQIPAILNGSLTGGFNVPLGATTVGGQSAYFDDMLRQSRRQPPNTNNANDANDNNTNNFNLNHTDFTHFEALPDLQLGLGDIAQRVRNIGAGGGAGSGARPPQAGDNSARYLLAASGIPVAATGRDLNHIAAQFGTAPPANPANDTDINIEGFLDGIASQTTLDIIGEGLEQAKRDFDSFLQESVHIQWDSQRRRIYEHFGLAKPSDDAPDFPESGAFGQSARQSRPFARTSTFAGGHRSVIGNPPLGASVLGRSTVGSRRDEPKMAPISSYDMSLQREKQEKYMAVVHELNIARLRDQTYPLIHKFREVEKTSGPDDNNILTDSFSSLIHVTGESGTSSSLAEPGAIRERHLADSYRAQDIDVRKRILEGSRKALEQSFLAKVEATIERFPHEANVGGVPSLTNKIRAYIRVGMARKEFGSDDEVLQFQMLNDDYLWMLIFFLLRAGLADEAGQYVASNQRAIQGIDRNFPQFIAHYSRDSERNLPMSLRTALIREWETQKKYPQEQIDPYRMACYKILGRIELERRTLQGINISHEDWIWLQFALARESRPTEELATSVFDLAALRKSVLDIGARHFSGGPESIDSPGTYFNLLMLAGLYEKAVGWLYDVNPITAIHFAIALDFYGLIRVSNIIQSEILASQGDDTWKINFGLLVGHYTADFRAAHPEIAADYLTLICLDSDLPGQQGKAQIELCHEALRELVLETREFTLLLGDIHEDGQRVRGVIEQRLKLIKLTDHKAFFGRISVQAASVAEDCGRISDAVILYHLSEDYDSVAKILNHTLADVVCTNLGEDTVKLDPIGHQKRSQKLKGKRPEPKNPDEAFSLTAVEDPADLAEKVYTLYSTRNEIRQRVEQQNWEVLVTLTQLARAREWADMALMESGRNPLDNMSHGGVVGVGNGPVHTGAWERALEAIRETNVLPLETNGDISAIRQFAAAFNRFQPELARTIGPLLLLTVTACGGERERLRSSPYSNETKRQRIGALGQVAKDLMVYAGLIRYRLESRVFEALARIGSDIDS